ncbi:hypothetical protein RND81_04G036300 [Saponaria officinalis]|uniref:peptidylprolyl isomerase n=1 Tax=Saponaria officinalis TaxID=3572 RepID=A0AAW1LG37_SAPOF
MEKLSTKDPGQEPFSFNVGQGKVIKGWDEGVLGMQLGEVARITIFRVLGYSRVSQHLLATTRDDGSFHMWDTTGKALRKNPKIPISNTMIPVKLYGLVEDSF